LTGVLLAGVRSAVNRVLEMTCGSQNSQAFLDWRDRDHDRLRKQRRFDRAALQQAFEQLDRNDRRRLIDKFKHDRDLNPLLDWAAWLSKNL
jgi:membrane-bound lytic murein transglycosylase B